MNHMTSQEKKIKNEKMPFYGLLIIAMLVGGWMGSVFAAVSINKYQHEKALHFIQTLKEKK